ncbi:hypothetical protein L207DRAFT_522551 [Hyaloscypha variabilis F]|uniref:Zn(2)-C6 fungal-type domain-containing protein n=1 Tax=Hyaloscypha variabilis (strain UAMH 11265 / GT02V1 / F) TaxID=1149755 RepID=A0A2J6S8L0_HYAVF|nr:hypothetical protein L207DRAFT_522551 [Hyaloscypha variabilis F]
MSFRKIRPSAGDSSASTSNPSQSTSESTGSDPRRVRGEKEPAESTTSSLSSKRRRVPESVTRNACLNCKKARAKCDGKKPCKRCATRVETSECTYEIHIKHAKEELVKQIKDLRAKDHMTEQILQALSTDEKVPEILERLKNGETYESIVEWLGRAPIDDFETLSPRLSQHSTFEASDYEMSGVASTKWTTVTSNTAVLDHLFQLYFAWIHPVHTLFSEGHFVDNYKRQSGNYCSSNLVNAICAMACHLHTAEGDDLDFDQFGTDFSDAVRSDIDADDKSIATIQAFAVMFLVDCARGNGLRASSYLQVATSSLSSVDYHQNEWLAEVWKNTVRGVRNLNMEWAQMTFQVPPTINPAVYHDCEENEEEMDAAKWYFYRYVNDQCPAWPGLLATTNREKSKLTAIIQDIVTMMYTHYGPQISAYNLLQQYGRLVAWREELPSTIGSIEENNGQALPHVLSLLILYSNTVVHLLRPLLDLEGFPSPLIEEIIWTNAQQGLFLLDEHYRTQYTCRYQPVLQMFSILHISDLVARFFPGGVEGGSKDGPEAIQFGTEALIQSRAGFPVAGPLQEMLRKTAKECSIRFPMNELMAVPKSPRGIYRTDDLIDACTRPSYIQPVNEIHSRYLPSISVDWVAEGAGLGFIEPGTGARRLRVASEEERGAQSLMQIRNLLNTA